MELRCRAGCEKTASSRSTSERCALGAAGISAANTRNRTRGRRTAPHTPLPVAPATGSTTPASKDRQRGRTARANRIRPMTMSSAPIRIDLRPGSAPSGSAMRSQSHRSLPRLDRTLRVLNGTSGSCPAGWSWAGWQVQVPLLAPADPPCDRPRSASGTVVPPYRSGCPPVPFPALPGRVWYFRACMTGKGCCPARAAVPLVATPRCASRAWIGSV